MKTEKVYIVTDLGPGDGGKGGVVHKITSMKDVHTIIKVGGAQGSHGVRTSAGESFAFSQWGCGTFEGVKTHLSSAFVALPIGLLNEANALRYGHGVTNPFDLLTIDETVLCATPYHGIASRLKEMARGNEPRGTIGTGVGEAVRDAERIPECVILAADLKRPDLRDRLAAVRDQVRKDLVPITAQPFLRADQPAVDKEIDRLNDDNFLSHIVERFREVAERATIIDHDFLGRIILNRKGAAVVEKSHGVLTDRFQGFHPHTSALRTLPRFTCAMLADAGFHGKIVNLGVTRAYQIRHGAGPMPTADPLMNDSLLPGSHKQENRFQGKVRVGPLDLVLLRYAIAVCGGPSAFDGLAITWFDQIRKNGAWHLCHAYGNAEDQIYFTPSGDIRVCVDDNADQLTHQRELGERLRTCIPKISTYTIEPSAEQNTFYELCAGLLQNSLGVPVRMVSFGATEREKMCK
ncbi:MAG TPA: adenylosuccinate synthetase [Patescibacteria group bacterium]|nr:adenylosuccinate synthetase [Patescibacteria group bacterium]